MLLLLIEHNVYLLPVYILIKISITLKVSKATLLRQIELLQSFHQLELCSLTLFSKLLSIQRKEV